MSKTKTPTGPAPERLKIAEDWTQAVGKALQKQKPAEGWPKSPAVPQRARKTTKRKTLK